MKSICQYIEEDKVNRNSLPYIGVKCGEEFKTRTFGEVMGDVQSFAKMLVSAGVSGNVMLYSPNCYEWAIADLAILAYVGVCVPIDSEWTAFDILNTLSIIDIDTIIYDRQKCEIIAELEQKYPNIRYICTDEFSKLLSAGEKSDITLCGRNNLDKTAMILFTSGTTDKPKAIPLTQKNLLHNWDALYARTPMSTADISYIFLPLNHVYAGVANFLYSIISGMRIYLCSDRSKMLEDMLKLRPTIVCTVPLILNRVYEAANESVMEMLRGIRFLYCGGSFTDLQIKRYFIENGVHLLEAYGTTETASVIALARPDDSNIECNGTILDGLDVRIIDPDENGVGELIVGGGSVSAGYLTGNNKYSEFDENGFYHTGDLGYIDSERRLFLKGRKKRMIITANGKNIYVDELESLILENPEIKAAAVFEEDYHPAAKIYTDLSEETVREFIEKVNTKLPKFKRIKNLYIRSESNGGRIK